MTTNWRPVDSPFHKLEIYLSFFISKWGKYYKESTRKEEKCIGCIQRIPKLANKREKGKQKTTHLSLLRVQSVYKACHWRSMIIIHIQSSPIHEVIYIYILCQRFIHFAYVSYISIIKLSVGLIFLHTVDRVNFGFLCGKCLNSIIELKTICMISGRSRRIIIYDYNEDKSQDTYRLILSSNSVNLQSLVR